MSCNIQYEKVHDVIHFLTEEGHVEVTFEAQESKLRHGKVIQYFKKTVAIMVTNYMAGRRKNSNNST